MTISNKSISNIISNNKPFILFAIFAFTIFLKNVLFLKYTLNFVFPYDYHTNLFDLIRHFLAKLTPGILLASFVFLFKKNWWTILISFILDIYIISNLIYFRTNNMLIDVPSIMIANNLNGLWSSIIPFIDLKVLSFLIITIFYSIILILFFKTNLNRNFKLFIICLISNLLIIAPISKISNGLNKNCFIPFSRYQAEKWFIYNYPKTESICAYLPASILFYIENYLTQEKITINQDDNDYLKQFINQTDTSIQLKPNSNLIIILVESMESWIFELNSMPKLSEYINNYPNIFAQSIKRQVMGGQSGDGQMIINTGLLPIKNGVACMLYGNNTYPNIAHNYTQSTTINPYPQIWNQNTVTYSYGYKNLIEFDGNDQKVFETLNSIIDTISIDFCIQAITLDTHLPYTLGEKEPLLNLPKETPKDLKNYLNCFKHLDNNLDNFLQKYFNSKLKDNTTLAIVSDHNIWLESFINDNKEFFSKYTTVKDETFCPLIIFSPEIKENINIKDTCYQMDIYPTLCNILGKENYYWKGFGKNLLDTLPRQIMDIEKCYDLSNKIIRSNYFKEKL